MKWKSHARNQYGVGVESHTLILGAVSDVFSRLNFLNPGAAFNQVIQVTVTVP